MPAIGSRPVGVTLIAVLLAINGLASLVEALRLAGLAYPGAPAAPPEAVGVLAAPVSALLGLLLIRRAYRVWNLRRGAWLITLVKVSIRGAINVLDLALGPHNPAAWISAVLTLATLLYLAWPSTRALFENPPTSH